jgi:hypothetical protein
MKSCDVAKWTGNFCYATALNMDFSDVGCFAAVSIQGAQQQLLLFTRERSSKGLLFTLLFFLLLFLLLLLG